MYVFTLEHNFQANQFDVVQLSQNAASLAGFAVQIHVKILKLANRQKG